MVDRHAFRGFTLIELLVVVAVIGALIAILVPSLSAARRHAYLVRCATNLRSLAHLDNQYAGDNGGVVPRNSGIGFGPTVFNLLARMQGINLIAGPNTGGFESEYATAYSKIKWLNCPSFPRNDQPISFLTNAFDPRAPGTEISYLPLKRIFRPSEVANFTEVNLNMPVTDFEVYDVWHSGHLAPNLNMPVTGGSSVGRICSDKRHAGKINLSYYDGHVEPKLITRITTRDFTGN